MSHGITSWLCSAVWIGSSWNGEPINISSALRHTDRSMPADGTRNCPGRSFMFAGAGLCQRHTGTYACGGNGFKKPREPEGYPSSLQGDHFAETSGTFPTR